MDFDAVVNFGPNIATQPTPRDVFVVMEASEPLYQTYITDYVWNSAPEGTQFVEVMEVNQFQPSHVLIFFFLDTPPLTPTLL